MPFSLMKPWHKLLLYFRTTWQLNMAERQAKHTTLPRILFPIRLQSVGHFHTGLDAAEPIGVLTYLVPATKNSTQNTSRESRDLQTKVMVALFGLFAEVENGPKKKDQCSLFCHRSGGYNQTLFSCLTQSRRRHNLVLAGHLQVR
jgi:hypothetical protein